jgi:glucosyl-3-phosphoglycerate synthase
VTDFHQRGPITTLPRLAGPDVERRERELVSLARSRPLILIIPSLITELDEPALAGMVREIRKAPYIDTVVVSLDRADQDGYRGALDYFRDIGHRTVVLWNHAPQILALRHEMEERFAAVSQRGKGRAVWMAIGLVLSEGRAKVVAFHDADVVNYDRSQLTNLVYPVLDPRLSFDFSKAYYARYTDRLNGRVTRLLMRPLLQAVETTVGRTSFISYLSAFRYPLAGELAFSAELLRLIRIPSDWGLEVGLLFEVLRQRSPRSICQVDIADQFEHKHQPLSPDDPTQGLHRMAIDIVKHLLRILCSAGIVLPGGSFQSMRVAYQRFAEDAVADYLAVAAFNGLVFDKNAEEEAVETFSRALQEACEQFVIQPLGAPSLPNWARVDSAIPDAGARLVATVADLGGVINT